MVEGLRQDTYGSGATELGCGVRKRKVGKEHRRPQRKRQGVSPGLDSQGDAIGLPG
jgi:hypothetical protein